MNPLGAAITALLALVISVGPRRWAAWAMMAGVLFLTQAQAVNIAGLNVFAMRFLEIAGFIRVIRRREVSFAAMNQIDRALLLLYTFTATVYCLRASEGQAYIVGTAVDAFLCYFTFRGLIVDVGDLRWFLRAFLVLLAPYALMVLYESQTHHNAFRALGGGMFDWTRGGRFRCVGSFRHPDLLGTLGATFVPLYIGLACSRAERRLACAGVGLCMLIVWASNSGGPLCATAVGVTGWLLWKARTEMRKIRWLMVGGVALAALVMKAPVWYLLAKISALTGGDGWHRSYLMDVSFQHMGKWWLFGMPVIETSEWFPYTLSTGADITNQFISFGLNAGLGAVLLLVLLLRRAFGDLGRALRVTRSASSVTAEDEFLLWGTGAMLAAHIATWFGVTYFDQIYAVWFMQLATIASITAACTTGKAYQVAGVAPGVHERNPGLELPVAPPQSPA